MKKFLLGSVAALSIAVSASSAQAADLMDVPVGYDWTGWYIGGNAGWGFSDVNVRYPNFPNLSVDDDGDGLLVGGYVGYNFHTASNFVFGVESDFIAATLVDRQKSLILAHRAVRNGAPR